MPPADPAKDKLPSECYVLTVRQNPKAGKATAGKEKDRKPVDPPPIIQLEIRDFRDPARNYLQSPYYMCVATLWDAQEDKIAEAGKDLSAPLSGALVSSLHKLKDINNQDGGFFVFGDLSVKPEGEFRLRFVLFEILDGEAISLQSVITEKFTVFSPKNFPGMEESTFLSRSFGDQGVRLRIRKDVRTAKRKPPNDDSQYHPKPRQDSSTSQVGYGIYGNEPLAYASRSQVGGHMEYLPKRQKHSSESTQSFEREAWPGYTQGPGSTALYSSHGVSGYSHESMPAQSHMAGAGQPHMGYQVAMRSPGSENPLAQHQFYGRGQVPDYNQAQQTGGFRPQGAHAQYVQQDPSNGLGQYPDSSRYSGMQQHTDHHSSLSPTGSQTQTMRSEFHQPLPDQSVRHQQYQMGMPSSTQASTALPSIGSTSHQATAPHILPSSNSYTGYVHAENRFVPPPQGGQPNLRTGYNTYPGGYNQIQANYPST